MHYRYSFPSLKPRLKAVKIDGVQENKVKSGPS